MDIKIHLGLPSVAPDWIHLIKNKYKEYVPNKNYIVTKSQYKDIFRPIINAPRTSVMIDVNSWKSLEKFLSSIDGCESLIIDQHLLMGGVGDCFRGNRKIPYLEQRLGRIREMFLGYNVELHLTLSCQLEVYCSAAHESQVSPNEIREDCIPSWANIVERVSKGFPECKVYAWNLELIDKMGSPYLSKIIDNPTFELPVEMQALWLEKARASLSAFENSISPQLSELMDQMFERDLRTIEKMNNVYCAPSI